MASTEERLLNMLENAKDRDRFIEIAIAVFRTFLEDDTAAKVS